MKVFQNGDKAVLNMVNESECPPKERLHFSLYNLYYPVPEGMIIYNQLSFACVFVKDAGNLSDEERDFFFHNFILIDNSVDDIYVGNLALKTLCGKKTKFTDKVNSFVILTTTDCNARCNYCYEKGIPKKYITPKIANDIVEWINNHSSKESPVSIQWFGGEPLFNRKAIDLISKGIKDNGFELNSSFISNGYLCTESNVKRMKDDWGCNSIQITLDGTYEAYNNTKCFIYNNKIDPFTRVIKNIHTLLDNNISVSIRLNVGMENYEEIEKTIDFLGKEFKKGRKPSVYVKELFERYDDGVTGSENLSFIFKKIIEMHAMLENYGLHKPSKLRRSIFDSHCMMENGKCLTIRPDGSLSTCEHFIDYNTIGSIYSDKYDVELVDKLKEKSPRTELCTHCPFYVSCLNLANCEGQQKECSIEYIDFIVQNTLEQVRVLYERNKESLSSE